MAGLDSELIKYLMMYVPLSVIGLWRWSFWLVRRFCATLYRPVTEPWPADQPKLSVSIITPVYNEDPEVFRAAMQSWLDNGANEIIAVIDKSNTRHIIDFERRYINNPAVKANCRMLVTPKPGKRAALCDGIEMAKGDLICLVDSDTIWSDDVIEKTLPYFLDPWVGGATVAQRIQNPDNVANVMFDLLLYSRYREEVPFLLGVGKVFNTLSGRTAFYRREALLNDRYDNVHLLRHEFFMTTRGISGDDKRLTHLIIQQGWHTAYVAGPVVLTPGLNSIRKFLKQRLRWTRNSWRADLRAVGKGWVWRHPALAVFMVDRFIQPIFMLLGPVVMTFALVRHEWLFAGILLAWWLVSRWVRVFGYFRAYPKRLVYLPAYIAYGYINAIIKIYALATLIENSWATRWHKSRAKRRSLLRKIYTLASGYAAVVVFLLCLVQVVLALRSQAGADIPLAPPVNQATLAADLASTGSKQAEPPKATNYVDPASVHTYVLAPGDTLETLSAQFGMTVTDLRRANSIADIDEVSVGQTIIHYKGTVR